jgi:hypothetical protein
MLVWSTDFLARLKHGISQARICAWTEGAAIGRHDTTYLENIKYNLISAYTNKLLWPRSMTISSIPWGPSTNHLSPTSFSPLQPLNAEYMGYMVHHSSWAYHAYQVGLTWWSLFMLCHVPMIEPMGCKAQPTRHDEPYRPKTKWVEPICAHAVPPVWLPLPASATTSYVGIIYSVTFYLLITLDATYNFCFCFLRCQIHSGCISNCWVKTFNKGWMKSSYFYSVFFLRCWFHSSTNLQFSCISKNQVTLHGDLKNQFVETTIGFYTICSVKNLDSNYWVGFSIYHVSCVKDIVVDSDSNCRQV